MRFRKLRIAWSVGWGFLAVLLIVLWVRDYLDTRLVASLPYAFPLLGAAGLAIAPWATGPTRFSLRTLLIATTLLAMLLGLAVWAASR